MSYFERLKAKWDVKSNLQLFIIFVVFAITGSSSVKVAKPLMDFLGIHLSSFDNIFLGFLIYWIIRILIVFPIYQILLLFFGILFFQFKFFWDFEKKILSKMGFKRFLKD